MKSLTKITPENFRAWWLLRFDLSAPTWEQSIRDKLADLPFAAESVSQENAELLGFLFRELPELLDDSGPVQKSMAMAYGWCCLLFWQSLNTFPAFPQSYARYLRDALIKQAGYTDQTAVLLGHLIGTAKSDGTCGLNRLRWDDPEMARQAESITESGSYEAFLTERGILKYNEYREWLQQDYGFSKDWDQIKSAFPEHTAQPVSRRTLIPERHWVKDGGASFSTANDQFQAVFDVFCWKYYLWSMKGDEPRLLKPSVNITPMGTQIFIPGYMSFDAKRDLNHGKIARLHRSRGVIRQGAFFSKHRTPEQ